MENLNYLNNPFTLAYIALRDFIFCRGHERFFNKVISFDTSEVEKLSSSGDAISAGILETNIKIVGMNSHSVTLTVTYDMLLNSGSQNWTAYAANANWWLVQRMVAAKRLQGFVVMFDETNIVSDVRLVDMREGLVPQDAQGMKSNLSGWNTFCQCEVDLTISFTAIATETEL